MFFNRPNQSIGVSRLCLGFGLLFSSAMVNGAFFQGVSEVTVPETIDGESIQLFDSVISPDGLFGYSRGIREIIIFSRDRVTGALSQVGTMNGASYPGGMSKVSFSPESLVISPDGNLLYMAGIFGGSDEGDAPITRQTTVVKFDRNADTGLLTFAGFIDMGALNFKSISQIVLSKDGSLLFVARTTGNPGDAEIHLVTTADMKSQFRLSDSEGTLMPNSTDLKLALSPDEQSLYAGGIGGNLKRADPALAVVGIDRNTNRLEFKQTIVEDYYQGLDTTVDISEKKALYWLSSIDPSEDGKFVYTAGNIRTDEGLNSQKKAAVGVWKVEDDATLSLVRTLDKQEVVNNVVGGEGDFLDLSDISLSRNGNHFLYLADNHSRTTGGENLTVFARNTDTGLLTYIDDNTGTTELTRVVDTSFSTDGRYIYVTMGMVARKIAVVDTAVDRAVVINNLSGEQENPDETNIVSDLQAIVSNNGPTDDYAVQVLFEPSANLSLSTSDENCAAQADGTVLCSVQQLFFSSQNTFDMVATASTISDTNMVSVTASSDKIDIDSVNDRDTVLTLEGSSDILVDDEEPEPPVAPAPDAQSDAVESKKSSGGGCSIVGLRGGFDLTFLILLLASAGIAFRRRKQFNKTV